MSRSHAHDETGSALMLMPAGVLIVVLLGAIAVDAAVLFLGERELADVTAAAANDAATAGLTPEAFYRCGELKIDAARAVVVADTAVRARSSDAVTVTSVDVSVRNDAVTVEARGTVELLFTPALPGARRSRAVGAHSTAEPHQLGPSGAVPAATCDGPNEDQRP